MKKMLRVAGIVLPPAFAILATACGDGGGTSVPGPQSVAPVTAVEQNVGAGLAVAEAPAVRVLDTRGQPLPGVGVTFTVTAGGGIIGTREARTNTAGVASATSWAVGAAAGLNTVTATVSGLPPVTFRAIAAAPCISRPYALFSTLQAALSPLECRLQEGEHAHLYTVTTPEAAKVTFTMRSADVDGRLELLDDERVVIASSGSGESGDAAVLRVVVPAGAHLLRVRAAGADRTGAYTLASSESATITGCERPWLVSGVEFTDEIAATDCEVEGGNADVYRMVLQPGQVIGFWMTRKNALNPRLALFDDSGWLLGESAHYSTAGLRYRVVRAGVYELHAGTSGPSKTGSYGLRVSEYLP